MILISKALRYGPRVTRGSHSSTCHPHTNHTCLYFQAARHHRPLDWWILYSGARLGVKPTTPQSQVRRSTDSAMPPHLSSALSSKQVSHTITSKIFNYLHHKMRDRLTKLNWQVQSKRPFEFGHAIGLIQSIRFNSYLYAKRSQETFGDCCRSIISHRTNSQYENNDLMLHLSSSSTSTPFLPVYNGTQPSGSKSAQTDETEPTASPWGRTADWFWIHQRFWIYRRFNNTDDPKSTNASRLADVPRDSDDPVVTSVTQSIWILDPPTVLDLPTLQ